MKFIFIADHRRQWPVRLQCRVLGVSASGFYDHVNRQPGPRRKRREQLSGRIERIHKDSRRTYGSPRVFKQLKGEGEAIGRKTVESIMRSGDLRGKSPRKRHPRTTDSGHHHPIAANVIQRDFTATAPNQKWLADITYLETGEGWLYLAAVLDCFSRRIVGWAAADHLRSELVEAALKNALQSRRPDSASGLIHHSDRGVQYASGSFQKLLNDQRIVASMSRKGNCYDNAMMESFFGTLKAELDQPLASHAAARLALFEYIEVFYNRQRLHSALGYKSPATCEQQHQVA